MGTAHFETDVTTLFSIEHPIVGGTMMWLSDAALTAAISNAGALGILCSAMSTSKQALVDELQKCKGLTQKPFAVNISLFPALSALPLDEYLQAVVDEGVAIVETSGHRAPDDIVKQLKPHGITCVHKCVAPRYAKKAEAVGVDAVTVVGWENGGATGTKDIATSILVPETVALLKIPVIGGGGVADGRGLAAMLSYGAGAAIIGTRLLLSEECPIHSDLKKALLDARSTDTRLILRTLQNTHRAWDNAAAKRVAELEARNAPLEELIPYITGQNAKKMFAEGMTDLGTISVGQSVGLIDEIMPVKDIIEGMVNEAKRIARQLAG